MKIILFIDYVFIFIEVITMSTAFINNIELFYEIQGQGPALIFTHGASLNHELWKPQIEYFSKYYTTIVWDLRGHGSSSRIKGSLNPEEFIQDLIELINYLDLKEVVLCGLSFGGQISIQLAAHFPELVKGLVLIGTPYTSACDYLEKLIMYSYHITNRILPTWLIAKLGGLLLSGFNIENKNFIEKSISGIPHKDWIKIWDTVAKTTCIDELSKINCPTLVLHGDSDYFTKRQQSFMVGSIKRVEYISIKDANHLSNRDNPLEINRCMATYLKSLNY